MLLFNGEGVDRDPAGALRLLHLAADQGDEQAQELLNELGADDG